MIGPSYDRLVRALLVLLVLAGTAHAGEHDALFAKAFGATLVRDVERLELPAGNDATHVMIGRFDAGKYAMTGALIMKCEPDCTWRRIEFGAADAVEVHGIVDLHGPPTALPNRVVRGPKIPGARAMKFPALVVRTREGKSRTKVYLVSLVDGDRASVVFMETAEDRNVSRSFRLETGDTKGVLDVVMKDGRCSEPTEQIYVLEDRHYRTKKYTPGKC